MFGDDAVSEMMREMRRQQEMFRQTDVIGQMTRDLNRAMELVKPQLSAMDAALKAVNDPVTRAMRAINEGAAAQALRDLNRRLP